MLIMHGANMKTWIR